jgi:hypothetical protein
MAYAFNLPVNGIWSPYSDPPGLGLELNPAIVQKYTLEMNFVRIN